MNIITIENLQKEKYYRKYLQKKNLALEMLKSYNIALVHFCNANNKRFDEGSTFTPKQRAVMIARTEISRVQNTGILQSYVNEGYTEVKILTAEDDNVCYTCLCI